MSAAHTDRELLELAAKAAGIMCSWAHDDEADYSAKTEGMWRNGARSPDNSKFWNPLTSDGDALRLAAVLRMEIDHNHPSDSEPWVSVRAAPTRICAVEEFEDESQRITATRRAIVRAAARARLEEKP